MPSDLAQKKVDLFCLHSRLILQREYEGYMKLECTTYDVYIKCQCTEKCYDLKAYQNPFETISSALTAITLAAAILPAKFDEVRRLY